MSGLNRDLMGARRPLGRPGSVRRTGLIRAGTISSTRLGGLRGPVRVCRSLGLARSLLVEPTGRRVPRCNVRRGLRPVALCQAGRCHSEPQERPWRPLFLWRWTGGTTATPQDGPRPVVLVINRTIRLGSTLRLDGQSRATSIRRPIQGRRAGRWVSSLALRRLVVLRVLSRV